MQQRSIIMNHLIDIDTRDKDNLPELQLAEEQFLEQFAALEEGLARLQNQMRCISEDAELFVGLATYIRRSICPTNLPSTAAPSCQTICALNIQRCASFR